jgi:hypothetical protein
VHLEVALFPLAELDSPSGKNLPFHYKSGKVYESDGDRGLSQVEEILEQVALVDEELKLEKILPGLSDQAISHMRDLFLYAHWLGGWLGNTSFLLGCHLFIYFKFSNIRAH